MDKKPLPMMTPPASPLRIEENRGLAVSQQQSHQLRKIPLTDGKAVYRKVQSAGIPANLRKAFKGK
jgi:hypothetical protein